MSKRSMPGSRWTCALVVAAAAALGACGASGETHFSGGSCASNAQCPAGQYCDDSKICTFDCRENTDCPGGTCSSIGKCVGQQTPDSGPAPDLGNWPDLGPAPDLSSPDPTPDGAISAADLGLDVGLPPDIGNDTVPAPINNNDCATPESLVLVSGMATASGTTTTATNGTTLGSTGCTEFTTPGRDRYYTVNLQGGKLYQVTLTPAASFDATLYVLTACDKLDSCEPGMGSDRLGKGTVETVLLAPLVSRSYLIVVDAYAGTEHGDYTLTIQEFNAPPVGDKCQSATQLTFSQGAATASGNTSGANNDSSLPADGCTGYSTPGPELFYAIYLQKDQTYQVRLRPAADFDPALAIFTACSDIAGTCQPGMGSDELGNGVAEEIVLRPSSAGLHYIMVDSFTPSEAGSFLLSIVEASGSPANDTCAGAETLELFGGSASGTGDTRVGSNKITLASSGCTGFSTAGNDHFFKFAGKANKQYKVTLEPASNFDAALYTFDGCADPQGTCGAGRGSDNVGKGVEESVTFSLASARDIYIGVDSYSQNEAGTFRVTVEEIGVPTCGPGTCSGCCNGNVCVAGGAKDACGTGGQSCQSCGTAKTCGPSGACVLDPDAWWRVVVESADVQPTDANGVMWDNAGAFEKPDPYCKLSIAGVSATTGIASDTTAPVWNQALLDAKASAIKQSLSLQVWDSDFIGDDLIGSCTAPLTNAHLLAGKVKLVGCGQADVTLSFFAL